MKIKFYIALLLLFSNCKLHANTWHTAKSGNWNSSSTWQETGNPSFKTNDTFFINHRVVFSENLLFKNNSIVKIDSTGGLCGHHTITLIEGAHFDVSGKLYCDSLLLHGGNMDGYSPAEIAITEFMQLKYSGSFYKSHGNYLKVGDQFTCVSEAGFKNLSQELVLKPISLTVYPNPSEGEVHFDIHESGNNFHLTITDLTGSIVYSKSQTQVQDLFTLTLPLSNGIYFYSMIFDTQKYATGKIQIINPNTPSSIDDQTDR
ncbi:MAG: T9SS type A sorting domain-containing protein [Bacteroidia bacterium]|nr:T9SS type A sorting domain-containing protein [Bacteroidia bacterium]